MSAMQALPHLIAVLLCDADPQTSQGSAIIDGLCHVYVRRMVFNALRHKLRNSTEYIRQRHVGHNEPQ